MPEAGARFRSGERTGIAAALAKTKFDRRTQERMGDMEFVVPMGEILRRRPISRVGLNPENILQYRHDIRKGGGALAGTIMRGERDELIERHGKLPEGHPYREIVEKLEGAPWIKRDPMILTARSQPDTRPKSYDTVIHEAFHQGIIRLENELGPGWFLNETKDLRDKYDVESSYRAEEVVARLIDYINGDKDQRSSDMIIDRYTDYQFGTTRNLAEQMLADPMVGDLIRRLQDKADLQIQHEGRPEGATRFAVDSIPETSDKRPPPEVRTTGPRDRLVAWRGRKKNP